MKDKFVDDCQEIYLSYSENIVPKLWKSLHQDKSVESILQGESSLYHKVAKNPDTQSSLSRFYSLYEPLILSAVDNYVETQKCIDSQKYFNSEGFDFLKYDESKAAIIFKGTHKLAHFDVLESCINMLNDDDKKKILLILIDYPPSTEDYFRKRLGIPNCIGLQSIGKTLKIRYHYCSFLLHHMRNLDAATFWGIPFGMLFISKLLKKFYQNNSIFIRYLTVKHKFSFNPAYINQLVNGAPSLAGYDYVNQSHLDLNPNFYTPQILKSQNINIKSTKANTPKSSGLLESVRSKNPDLIVAGIFARKEKLLPNYLTDLKKFVNSLSDDIKKKIVFAICSKDPIISKYIADSTGIFTVNLEWSESYISYFNYIDVFLDTYPFGGGLLLAQALTRGVPVIASNEYLSTSPSSIHAIMSRGLPLMAKNNARNADCVLKYMIHDTPLKYWTAFKNILIQPSLLREMIPVSRELGEVSFLAQSESQGRSLALKYLSLA